MWHKVGKGHTNTISGTEWKPKRQILTASEVDDEGFNSGGSIELRIDRFSEFVRDGKRRLSVPMYIRGLSWIMCAEALNNGQSPFKDLAIYLCRTSKTRKWRAIISLRVVAQKGGVEDIIRQDTMTYYLTMACSFWKPWNVATCDMLLDPEKGFIKDDTIILQAHIQLLSVEIMSGIRLPNKRIGTPQIGVQCASLSWVHAAQSAAWTHKRPTHRTPTRQFPIPQQYLAMHSEFFKDQCAKHERDNRAILQDVRYCDFIEMLTVIYPSLCPITAGNVEPITELAFKFYMADLLKRCEVFLMENISKFDRAEMLLIAECYGLADLQETIIEQIKSVTDIKAMKPDYHSLSDQTKRMLFNKICPPVSVSNLASELEGLSITADRATDILQELESSAHCAPSGVLVVENNRIPIHKEHLAIYSKFFKQMFQGDFAERNMEEFVLEEVYYNEILELLMVIYPTKQQLSVTEKNVGVILKMADRFIMPAILERCKKLLQDSTQISTARKLWLAQRYSLPDLQVEYAKKYKTMSDVDELRAEPEFGLLDDKTRVLILDSIIS